MQYLYPYLLLINALTFLIMLLDKHRARKNLWRIPEATLFAVAILGGSLGAMIGMNLFRHKTRHPKFSIGLPVIFAVQVVLAVVFLSM